jgi:hypothetical protein
MVKPLPSVFMPFIRCFPHLPVRTRFKVLRTWEIYPRSRVFSAATYNRGTAMFFYLVLLSVSITW